MQAGRLTGVTRRPGCLDRGHQPLTAVFLHQAGRRRSRERLRSRGRRKEPGRSCRVQWREARGLRAFLAGRKARMRCVNPVSGVRRAGAARVLNHMAEEAAGIVETV